MRRRGARASDATKICGARVAPHGGRVTTLMEPASGRPEASDPRRCACPSARIKGPQKSRAAESGWCRPRRANSAWPADTTDLVADRTRTEQDNTPSEGGRRRACQRSWLSALDRRAQKIRLDMAWRTGSTLVRARAAPSAERAELADLIRRRSRHVLGSVAGTHPGSSPTPPCAASAGCHAGHPRTARETRPGSGHRCPFPRTTPTNVAVDTASGLHPTATL